MRTSISIDDNIAELAEKVAERESRNFSNLCEVALKEYCGDRALPVEEAELLASAKEVGVKNALAAVDALKRPHRKRAA